MAKQKATTLKRAIFCKRFSSASRSLHQRRACWFAILTFGLIAIQLAYNIHNAGAPQVLGYATSVSNEILLTDANSYRTQAGLKNLVINTKLERAAQAKADDMIAKNYWSHTSPDGTEPWKFIQQANYDYDLAGENLAYGFSTSEQITAAWMNSPEHRDNLLGKYTEVGFGVANGKDYQNGDNTVVVAMYAAPSNREIATSGSSTASQPTPSQSAPTKAKHVNGLAAIFSGSAPWAVYASLALIGATLFGFMVTHLENLKSSWQNAKRYALMHPAIDATVLVGILVIIIQASGGFIR